MNRKKEGGRAGGRAGGKQRHRVRRAGVRRAGVCITKTYSCATTETKVSAWMRVSSSRFGLSAVPRKSSSSVRMCLLRTGDSCMQLRREAGAGF